MSQLRCASAPWVAFQNETVQSWIWYWKMDLILESFWNSRIVTHGPSTTFTGTQRRNPRIMLFSAVTCISTTFLDRYMHFYYFSRYHRKHVAKLWCAFSCYIFLRILNRIHCHWMQICTVCRWYFHLKQNVYAKSRNSVMNFSQ